MHVMVRPPKVCLLDWDGTLVHSTSLFYAAVKHVFFEERYAPISYKEFRKVYGDSLGKLLKDRNFSKFQADKLYKKILIKMKQPYLRLKHLKLVCDAQKFLALCRDHDILLGVVSNKYGLLVRQEAQWLKIDSYFTTILGNGDTPYEKPAPESLWHALKDIVFQTGIPINSLYDDVWFIGNAPIDMIAAKNSGIHGICIQPQTYFHNVEWILLESLKNK
jgi:phosphoglycolate phosphatase-like HAD superfamily hydrolase